MKQISQQYVWQPLKKFVSWGTEGQTELQSLRLATLNVCGGLFIATMSVLVLLRFVQGRFLHAGLELLAGLVVGFAMYLAKRGGFNHAALLLATAPALVAFFLIHIGVYDGIHMMPQLGMTMLTCTLIFSSARYRTGFIVFCLLLMAIAALGVPASPLQIGVFLFQSVCFALIFVCFVAFFERQELNLLRTIDDLEESNREKNEANHKLNDRIEELIVFSHIMSHDLKGPLSGISGYAQLLKMDLASGASDEQNQKSLAAISTSAANMNAIITDLMTYTEVSVGACSNEEVDLNKVVAHALSLLNYQIRQNGALVECSDLPTIQGNTDMLSTVFYNLFSNGLKYQPKDVPGHRPSLKLWPEWGASGVQVFIRDNGIGISDQYLPDLFSPFRREHQSAYEGTGLGMPICMSILEKIGGDISVKETGADGTLFQLTFPAAKPASASADLSTAALGYARDIPCRIFCRQGPGVKTPGWGKSSVPDGPVL